MLEYLRSSRIYSVKRGCDNGECGACTILVDGKAQNACLMLMHTVQDCVIETVESFTDKLKFLTEKFSLKFFYNKRNKPSFYAQILRFTPNPDIRRIKAKIYEQFTDKLTDFLLENNLLWADIDTIEIQVDLKVEQFIRREVDSRVKKGELLKYLFRKNYTLKLFDNVTKDKNKLIYKLYNVCLEKVKRVDDITEEGTISFDKPEICYNDIDGYVEHIKR